MRRLDAGGSGSPFAETPLGELEGVVDDQWTKLLSSWLDSRGLRPIQREALVVSRILDSRRNLVVCAPTNGGKSLVGSLVLLDAIRRGRRAVLLEPLRALASEQADTLRDTLAKTAGLVSQGTPRVRLSTGDFRLEGEYPADLPPTEGELIVATPERFDAILRNPKNAAWAATIGAVVIDEAHLIGDTRRGPTLELVIASMLALASPPRIALLSATVGEPERLSDWLRPCDLVLSQARPLLRKEVWALEAGDSPDDLLLGEVTAVVEELGSAVLVFVYQRAAAEALAHRISSEGTLALAYHSGLTSARRREIREAYRAGECRVLVATTALAMGVNLPATHVYVRDSTFHGVGRLGVDQLLQIMGRAGRGDRSGFAAVLVRQSDEWDPKDLAQSLAREELPALRSTFERTSSRLARDRSAADSSVASASLVATCLARAAEEGQSSEQVSQLLGHTLGASGLVQRVPAALRWLEEPPQLLAYHDEAGLWRLTALGQAGTRAMLPLLYVSGLGQLVRDLLSVDPAGRLLSRWTVLDHLLVVALLSGRAPTVRRFSESLAERIEGWIEASPIEAKSLLFADWAAGSASSSRASELLGSLGLGGGDAPAARRQAYQAMLSAILLWERSRGTPIDELERRWGVDGLAGTEETWRDAAIWSLAGHARLFELRSFYFHLKEHCRADNTRISEMEKTFRNLRAQAYDLTESLTYCSPLGPLMRGVRGMVRASGDAAIGVGTIRALESAGAHSVGQVAAMSFDDLVEAGVQPRFAKQIRAYVGRRSR